MSIATEPTTLPAALQAIRAVALSTGTAMTRNPRFVRELEVKVGKNATILLLCRSGKRSALAAQEAA